MVQPCSGCSLCSLEYPGIFCPGFCYELCASLPYGQRMNVFVVVTTGTADSRMHLQDAEKLAVSKGKMKWLRALLCIGRAPVN